MILTLLNAVVAFGTALIGIVLLLKVEEQKEGVLFLFLEIPIMSVDGIRKRRDKFMEYFEVRREKGVYILYESLKI